MENQSQFNVTILPESSEQNSTTNMEEVLIYTIIIIYANIIKKTDLYPFLYERTEYTQRLLDRFQKFFPYLIEYYTR